MSPWAAVERSCALWEQADVKDRGKNRRKTGTEGYYFHGSGSSTLCSDAGSIEVTAVATMNSLTEWLFLGTVGLYLTPPPFVFAVSCSILAGLKKRGVETSVWEGYLIFNIWSTNVIFGV